MGSSLAHVMVVGGTRRDWDAIDEAHWSALTEELGAVVAAAGGAWLTIRAYERGTGSPDGAGSPGDGGRRWHEVVADGHCTVIIDPLSDGRERFAEAMRRLPAGATIDEKAVAGVLYEPADVEPDLVLVLGPSTRLPPSLVWELAYGELVFVAAHVADLQPEHLEAAIADFHGRRRRFGGLDS